MTIRSWTDAEVTSDANLAEMRDSGAKARAYGREIVRLRELLRTFEPLATAVMEEHDEETTGSVALDNLINHAMACATDVRPPRGAPVVPVFQIAALPIDPAADDIEKLLAEKRATPAEGTCGTCQGTGLRGFGVPGIGPCPDCNKDGGR